MVIHDLGQFLLVFHLLAIDSDDQVSAHSNRNIAQESALAAAAQAGAQSTVSMQALKGRASYLGPRSVGHEDPGTASMALILGALRDVAARQAT